MREALLSGTLYILGRCAQAQEQLWLRFLYQST